jgi:hypothetical protein
MRKIAAFTLVSGSCFLGPLGCFGVAIGEPPEDSADGQEGPVAPEEEASFGTAWEALLVDGELPTLLSSPAFTPTPTSPPPSDCLGCSEQPLAFWTLDDCNADSTLLADSAYGGLTSHPAFRAVGAGCAPGASGQGVRLAQEEDVVYAPDQPDFNFDQGLTIAAFIQPERLRGTQSIVRKRFEGDSSFVLAIENRRLSFVVRLASGRVAGVSADVEVGRFQHVAATYDGRQLQLYVDGQLIQRARASGKLARGAGPLIIGNDADGRRFQGVVDELWLDDRAASAETIRGLTCIHRPPLLALEPSASTPQIAGDTVHYELAITNQNDASCAASQLSYYPSIPFPLGSESYGSVTLAPGETTRAMLDVYSQRNALPGSYPFDVQVYDESSYTSYAQTQGTFVVGTGPLACLGAPPFTPLVLGSPNSPGVGTATYAAPGLQPLTVTELRSSEGTLQALNVLAQPGEPLNPADNWFGVVLFMGNPSCVDASAYGGVRFTIEGDLGTCLLQLEANTSEDNQVAFGGSCPDSVCYGPLSAPVGTGTTVVRFADMSGGVPLPTVDPTQLQGIQWALSTPTDGSPPCQAQFTIRDVAFIE